MKICLKCGLHKEPSEFNKDKLRKDGLAVYCRPCNKKIQATYYANKYGSTHPLKKLKTLPAEQRFHAAYVKTANGCWIWQGTKRGSNGYGVIKQNGVMTPAHRYSWQLFNGSIPAEMLVCHTCDTPLCVNPEHLFLGTHQDNSDDKVRKGRQAKGKQLGIAQQLGKMFLISKGAQ